MLMATMPNIQTNSKRFPGRYDQIRPICSFILEAVDQTTFDSKTRFHIELSCDEAATNIIEHAYNGENRGEILASWELNETALIIQLHDQGKPFAPNLIALPKSLDESVPIDDITIGGLGVHMMRKTMDDLQFSFNSDGNTVTLMKWLPPDSPIWHRQLLNGIDVVAIDGRLDAELSPTMEQLLTELVAQDAPHIIIDLSRCDYVNSGGLRILVSAWRSAHKKDGDVVLCGLNEALTEIFSMVGFDKIFRIYPDLDDAKLHFE